MPSENKIYTFIEYVSDPRIWGEVLGGVSVQPKVLIRRTWCATIGVVFGFEIQT